MDSYSMKLFHKHPQELFAQELQVNYMNFSRLGGSSFVLNMRLPHQLLY